jgi:phosphoglycolate phosphatase-like HAD superfamily hydrolase
MATHPHLLLFDIDGTLIDSGSAGMSAIKKALAELYPSQVEAIGGAPDLDLAGSTDSGIAMDMFGRLGVEDTPAERERFYTTYLGHLRTNLGEPGTRGRLLDGVGALLGSLAERQSDGEVLIGLLTGNIADGARVKVDYYGVGEHFSWGAYGDDHHDRNRLGPVAVKRAGEHLGRALESAPATVIGDTPKDIRCARAMGARVLAVATGGVSEQALAEHSPDVLLPDLADRDVVLGALLG